LTDMEVRIARPEDLAAVTSVVSEAYEPWAQRLGFRPGPLYADYAALIDAKRVYLAGDDAIIVLVPEEHWLVVENVAVRPESQGRGIGRALLVFAETEAARRDLTEVRLYTHERMESNAALYRKLGYIETGRQAVAAGSLIHFRKPLKSPSESS
jgi:ribosomal protein S18 acetylase RimI-like enzyme